MPLVLQEALTLQEESSLYQASSGFEKSDPQPTSFLRGTLHLDLLSASEAALGSRDLRPKQGGSEHAKRSFTNIHDRSMAETFHGTLNPKLM